MKKHLQTVLFLLFLVFGFTGFSQNDSIFPNKYGEYTIWEHGQSKTYERKIEILPSHFLGETNTLLVKADDQDTLGKLLLDGDKIWFKILPYSNASIMFNQYVKDTNDYVLLYDFGLQVGDTAFLRFDGGSDIEYVKVLEVSTTIVQGEVRKVIRTYIDEWTQGIGSWQHPLRPLLRDFEVGPNEICKAMLSYEGPSPIDTLSINENANCTVGTQELNKEGEITVFPNPSSGKIYFSGLDMQNIKSIDLKTIEGKSIKFFTKEDNFDNMIQIDFLDSGIYLLEIMASQSKFIKQIYIQ